MTAGNDKRPVAAADSERRALSGSGGGQRLQWRRKEQRQQSQVIMCFVLIKPIIDDVHIMIKCTATPGSCWYSWPYAVRGWQ
jgi:hypothetical protein